jgi:hypothetical protein
VLTNNGYVADIVSEADVLRKRNAASGGSAPGCPGSPAANGNRRTRGPQPS